MQLLAGILVVLVVLTIFSVMAKSATPLIVGLMFGFAVFLIVGHILFPSDGGQSKIVNPQIPNTLKTGPSGATGSSGPTGTFSPLPTPTGPLPLLPPPSSTGTPVSTPTPTPTSK